MCVFHCVCERGCATVYIIFHFVVIKSLCKGPFVAILLGTVVLQWYHSGVTVVLQ
jgi:hypothetical protein